MEFQLALLRHAEAQASVVHMLDFDRPLTQNGRSQADHIARKINVCGLKFAKVLCSPALRTKQTLEYLKLSDETPITYLKSLYGGSIADYIKAIRNECHYPVLLIGHNPNIHGLLLKLCKTGSLTTPLPNTYETACLSLLSKQGDSPISEFNKADLVSYIEP